MWIKNFRHKKLQSLLIFTIIMLCSMLLSASISILISLDKPYKQFAKECNSATAVMFPYPAKEDEVISIGEQFASLPNVERVEYNRVHYISEELTFNAKKIESFAKLSEYNDAIYSKIRYLQGDKGVSNNLKENECIIPSCISNKYSINAYDVIKLQLENKEIIYTVAGVYSEIYNTSNSSSSCILVKKLPEGVDQSLNIYLYGKDEANGRDIAEAYRDKYDGQMNGEIFTLESAISNILLPSNILGGILLAIGIIILLVSCIIINFMVRSAMITDAKTIAIYKTIGYTYSDILKMYLTFYFVVVSLGCILGIGGSVYLSNSILSSVFKNIGQVVSNNVLLPGIFCYTVIVCFVLGVIYSVTRRTKKVKPVYALNGMINTSTKKKRNYKGNSKMQFSPLGIALRTLSRNKKGAVSIIITAVVTIFSINFAIISLDVVYTMKNNNDYWLGVDKCDVMIDVTDKNQWDQVEKIVKEDSRIHYYLGSNRNTGVTMKWKKGMNSTALNGFVFDDYSKAHLPIIKGRNPQEGNEIAITSKTAGELNKTVGDYLEVYVAGEQRADLLITGIFQSYYNMGNTCRLTKDVFIDKGYDWEFRTFSIYLKDQKNLNSFIKDIKERVGSYGKVYARTEALSSIMDTITEPQERALPPVVVLVLLVGAINVFCIVLLKNASSEKNNGIYKCLGYSTWHLILANLYYVGIVAVTSIVVAVPMIIALYPTIMRKCLGMFGFLEYKVNYNLWHMALANIVVLIVFIVSTLISSHSLKKVNVRDLVQE
jgi:putative ABC transport system permease protein